ncbi:41670_t:CDS:2 [Gigaspora margarita]|uniref:41670_t:CDS:1 n=1 Tax=Gigaspora margarita TaxID=4874 RepID=A0ABM8W7D2_GIGMA|nr:41670_t:CDS:2 [Gigaspora margarita]
MAGTKDYIRSKTTNVEIVMNLMEEQGIEIIGLYKSNISKSAKKWPTKRDSNYISF